MLTIRDRVNILSLYGDLGSLILLEAMAVALCSDKEEEEIWGINSLRSWGEMRKKQTAELRNKSREEYLSLIKKLIEEAER